MTRGAKMVARIVASFRRHPILLSLLVLVFILLAPFVVARVVSDIVLFRFASQLSVFTPDSDPFAVLAEGSQVDAADGSGSYCTYRATRVLRVYADIGYWRDWVSEQTVSPARHRGEKPQRVVTVFSSGQDMVISIEDGPYAAGLDLRCW